jgi:hypothetical protein
MPSRDGMVVWTAQISSAERLRGLPSAEPNGINRCELDKVGMDAGTPYESGGGS